MLMGLRGHMRNLVHVSWTFHFFWHKSITLISLVAIEQFGNIVRGRINHDWSWRRTC